MGHTGWGGRTGRGRHKDCSFDSTAQTAHGGHQSIGEAARQRDRGKEARSLSALLGRAKVAMKGRENLRDFEDEGGTIRSYLVASAMIWRKGVECLD